jgi:hypothetical protein
MNAAPAAGEEGARDVVRRGVVCRWRSRIKVTAGDACGAVVSARAQQKGRPLSAPTSLDPYRPDRQSSCALRAAGLPRCRIHRGIGAALALASAPTSRVSVVPPRVIAAYRGGDNHFLSGASNRSRMRVSICRCSSEVAPEILRCPKAPGRAQPSESATVPMSPGPRLSARCWRFDIGQAVVVAGRHVLAVEAAEGTDAMLGAQQRCVRTVGCARHAVLVC